MGIRLWNVPKLITSDRPLDHSLTALSVSWDPIRGQLLSAHGQEVRTWTESGEMLSSSPIDASIVTWAQGGRCYATIGADGVGLLDRDGHTLARRDLPQDAGTIRLGWDEQSSAFGLVIIGRPIERCCATVLSERGVTELGLGDVPGQLVDAAWSRSGAMLGLVADDAAGVELIVWQAGGEEQRLPIPTDLPDVAAVAWLSDESLALAGGADVIVWARGTATVAARRTFDAPVLWMQASPDGQMLALATEDGQIVVVDDDLRVISSSEGGLTGGGYWSRDGRWLATFADAFNIYAVEPASRTSIAFAVDDVINDVAWHPNRDRLAAAGRAGIYLLDVVR
jgi:WD40 repeat protein